MTEALIEANRPQPAVAVVGLGASAGGLAAIRDFFTRLPANGDFAYVVIQHLSPDFKSMMDEILQRHTDLSVQVIKDKTMLRPNHIYLNVPRKDVVVRQNQLCLEEFDESRLQHPIDRFFESMAREYENNAIAVVLSGTGTDGRDGARAVHQAGGLVFVQEPATAEFDGMPKATASTGIADYILPPNEMGKILDRRFTIRDGGEHAQWGPETEPYTDVIALMRSYYALNFAHYKADTVLRRIKRRIELLKLADVPSYLHHLRTHHPEREQLYRDLLIGVTRFFRDPDAFELLEQVVIPKLVEQSQGTIRVWTPGCASGEEAYSLAILFREFIEKHPDAGDVKIFATDMHKGSLNTASNGIYDEEALALMSPERKEKYFRQVNGKYSITKDIRQSMVFAPHDVLSHPAFTRMDLITCRNLLIYIAPDSQEQILSTFHYGLRDHGVLFLGPSETLGRLDSNFHTIDRRWKIFEKVPGLSDPVMRRIARRPTQVSPKLYSRFDGSSSAAVAYSPPAEGQVMGCYDRLLDDIGRSGFLLDGQRNLIHTFGDAGKYLQYSGRTTTQFLDLIQEELRSALRAAIFRAERSQAAVSHPNVEWKAGLPLVNVQVEIMGNGEHSRPLLISLTEATTPKVPTPEHAEAMAQAATASHIGDLERELRDTREHLQAVMEQADTSHEELQSMNEELIASNEELQSTNEELQSVNEELYTVNAEYQQKIGELTELTADMDNLLNSTEIGTVFLDAEYRIRRFTPAVTPVFRLLPQDIGRSLGDIVHLLNAEDLMASVRQVCESGEPQEREVTDSSGHPLLLRLNPYRLSDGQIDGVVLTLIKMTLLESTQVNLRARSTMLDTLDVAAFAVDTSHDDRLALSYANRRANELKCIRVGEVLESPSMQDFLGSEGCEHLRHTAATGASNRFTVTTTATGGSTAATFDIRSFGLGPGRAGVLCEDISQRIENERMMNQRAEDLAKANEDLQQFAYVASHDLREPLRAVETFSELIEKNAPPSLPEKQKSWFGYVRDGTAQMRSLIDDLLKYSRVGTRGVALAPVPSKEALADALDNLRLSVGESNAKITSDYLPSVMADRDQLVQVFQNLISNAIKFRKGPGPNIHVSAKENGDHWEFRVTDDGIGIAPEHHERIFAAFQTLHSRDQFDGNGLGLSIVKRVLERHRSSIRVESTEGNGSTFIFSLKAP